MSNYVSKPEESLQKMAEGDLTLVNALQRIIEGSYEESGLDPQTFMLVRIAALATLDAPPASWLMNLEVGGVAGLEPETILGVLIAIAPAIGTPRIVSAAGNIVRAFALQQELDDNRG